MTDKITFSIDGIQIEAEPGQTILEAAEQAGVYIPRLCYQKDLSTFGSCRVCTVLANGRPVAACTQPVAKGMVVENENEKVLEYRRQIVEMLFVEGNHYCMYCDKSGNCELQAMAYRLGITSPRHIYQFPQRELDATHPEVFIDRNRCILCGRCVRASKELDGKNVFQFVGWGPNKKVAVNAEGKLSDTELAGVDKAIDVCPVGAIMRKGVGYAKPVGQRLYDHKPIGSDVEGK